MDWYWWETSRHEMFSKILPSKRMKSILWETNFPEWLYEFGKDFVFYISPAGSLNRNKSLFFVQTCILY